MKDKNGIEICCENCAHKGLLLNPPGNCACCPNLNFVPSPEAYKARIAELQRHEQTHHEDIKKIEKALYMATDELDKFKRHGRKRR